MIFLKQVLMNCYIRFSLCLLFLSTLYITMSSSHSTCFCFFLEHDSVLFKLCWLVNLTSLGIFFLRCENMTSFSHHTNRTIQKNILLCVSPYFNLFSMFFFLNYSLKIYIYSTLKVIHSESCCYYVLLIIFINQIPYPSD
jgi:hypothetical protein